MIAESGCLVLISFYTSHVFSTIKRFLDLYPESDKKKAQDAFAYNLRFILCQKLRYNREKDVMMQYQIVENNDINRACIKENTFTDMHVTSNYPQKNNNAKSDVDVIC